MLSYEEKYKLLMELAHAYGYYSKEDLLRYAITADICPAICVDCGYTDELEPDQGQGFCEQCGQNTMQSTLTLAGLI